MRTTGSIVDRLERSTYNPAFEGAFLAVIRAPRAGVQSRGIALGHRILIVSHSFPPTVGGISRLVANTAAALPAASITVLTSSGVGLSRFRGYDAARDEVRTHDAELPYRIHRVWYSQRSKLSTIVSVANLGLRALLLAIREKPRAIYFGAAYPIGLIGLPLRALGIPYIAQTHGSELLGRSGRSRLRRLVLRKAARVIANSAWGRSVLVGMGIDESRIAVLNPAIQLERFARPHDLDLFKAREGLTGRPVLLTVARLTERKGQQLVIAALPQIRAKYPDVIYVVVGRGPAEENLRAEARVRGVEDAVRLVGDRNVVDFYHACDVFVMPSLYHEGSQADVESFGITYIEANACRKPVIGADNGGVRDAVAAGESGLLVRTGNVAELAQAILRLLDDPALARRLGEQGFERVKRDFTERTYGQKLRELVFAPLGIELPQDQHA